LHTTPFPRIIEMIQKMVYLVINMEMERKGNLRNPNIPMQESFKVKQTSMYSWRIYV
jgi:hypothetical protein